ncbi:hypothetical protein [Pseudoxanthomonas japonensis]|uniref:hypothetical protein n=1 Tax=Pseudoxanthomonas japonensis TaxID=69284 RepID=UPI001BCEB648|nr:hypothetical protein [Pseudoxanthomonas japonensis]
MTRSTLQPSRTCWAAALGGCNKMSREHVVSQSVFADGCGCPLIIEGGHRVPSGPLAISSLAANILCRKHNSALSSLDAEAGRLAAALLASARGKEIGRPELDGGLIERWVLKTLINGLVAGWSDQRKWIPHASIVQAIYGLAAIPHGCGLYSVDGDSSDLPNPQGAQIAPYWAKVSETEKHLVGGLVRIHGLRLFVATHDSIVPQIVGQPEAPPRVFENNEIRFVYRPAFISVDSLASNKNGIILRWQPVNGYRGRERTQSTSPQSSLGKETPS